MYVFPEEIRKAYEAIPIPQVFYQLIDGKVVPLLVSDGFCRLVKLDREETIKFEFAFLSCGGCHNDQSEHKA